jgi:hypothetical protein
MAWAEAHREVDSLRDGILRPVDPKIKPVVVALRANGLATSSSCQGHVDEWQPFPVVSFNAPLIDRGAWQAPLVPSYRNALRSQLERV